MVSEEMENNKSEVSKFPVPSMDINCDLQIDVENKNKVIYVSPGKLQYFTASAICHCDDKELKINYCGCNAKCICGEIVIRGCLGYYKIVKSGIIFIPSHNLNRFHNNLFPTDILPFSVEGKDLKFDVVFTYSKYIDCKCACNR